MGATRVIYGERDIAKEIRRLFETTTGERIVITAFVGLNPRRYVGDPIGMEIYCWPHPLATHPRGLRDLFGLAELYFVKNLHMKIYWSDRGAVVGSANLSGSALDEGGLSEAAVVFDDPADVPIAQIKRSLKGVEKVDEDILNRFERLFNRSRPKNEPKPRSEGSNRSASFAEWLALPAPPPWKLAFVEYDADIALSSAGAARLRQQMHDPTRDNPEPIFMMRGDGTSIKPGQWILTAHCSKHDKVTSLSWMFSDYVIQNDARSNDGHLVLQMHRHALSAAPFNAKDDTLRVALSSLASRGKLDLRRIYHGGSKPLMRRIAKEIPAS